VKGLLHTNKSSTESQPGLCNSFATFFIGKIQKVKASVDAMMLQMNLQTIQDQVVNGPSFSHLEPTSVDEVLKLIARLPNKTSPLDYLHTSVIKSCSDVMAALIAHLANLSFAEGYFPAKFKLAQVSPLLKKAGLDEGIRRTTVRYRT
jgi:hypothetical protein